MNEHPKWLQYIVAFGGPFSATLPTSLMMAMNAPPTQAGWYMGIAVSNSLSAGFGGLVGLGFNDWRKAVAKDANSDERKRRAAKKRK